MRSLMGRRAVTALAVALLIGSCGADDEPVITEGGTTESSVPDVTTTEPPPTASTTSSDPPPTTVPAESPGPGSVEDSTSTSTSTAPQVGSCYSGYPTTTYGMNGCLDGDGSYVPPGQAPQHPPEWAEDYDGE